VEDAPVNVEELPRDVEELPKGTEEAAGSGTLDALELDVEAQEDTAGSVEERPAEVADADKPIKEVDTRQTGSVQVMILVSVLVTTEVESDVRIEIFVPDVTGWPAGQVVVFICITTVV